MGEALKLAKQGMGYVGANPLVGAVFVKDGKIIGSGHHKNFGGPHAEVNALENLRLQGFEARGATLYCTLEPCSHINKKTPPCAQMLTQLGIVKVVIATLDPNPEVSGRGVLILKEAGIEVQVGVLANEALELNRRFFYHIENKLPYIAVKWAQTLDGYVYLNKSESKYLTSIESRVDVHHDRQFYENILIGGETLRIDNPKLDCRNFNVHYCPNRFVLTDLNKMTDLNYTIFNDEFPAKTFVVTSECLKEVAKKNKAELLSRKVNVIEYSEGDSLKKIFSKLYELNFTSFYIESGGKLFQSLESENLINELIVYIAPRFSTLNGGIKLGRVNGQWSLFSNIESGGDVKLVYHRI